MDPQQQRENLQKLWDTLPQAVVDQLLAKNIDIVIVVSEITDRYELMLYETGNICEGVLRVLKGEDTPSNLVAFTEKDEHIEEDNRPKIAALAYEIQTKIFDQVLPILKQAGFPIKEGRVQEPVMKYESPLEKGALPSSAYTDTSAGRSAGGMPTPSVLADSAASLAREDRGTGLPPLDDKNVRALVRIAAGTNYSEAQLREAFEDLPQGLRQSISSVDTANAIQQIAKKYFLHVDQMASLASETGLVLLGLTHPAEFIENLAKRLHLPEERAKEIAREVSAQILVKVREALRTLHEESSGNPKFENRNPKQIPNPNIQSQPKPAAEPLKRIEVMPQKENIEYRNPHLRSDASDGQAKSEKYQNAKQENIESQRGASQSQSSVGQDPGRSSEKYEVRKEEQPQRTTPPIKTEGELNATRYTSNTGLQTPYSAGAKWNTGDNILTRQAMQKTESLNREEMLRDIENPRRIERPTTNYQRPTTKPNEVVGPTGWKPQQNEVGSMKYEVRKEAGPLKASAIPSSPQRPPLPVPPMMPKPSVPTAPPPKARPQSESAIPPTLQNANNEENFLDQKLQAPMSLPKEEKRYTTDPYREPLQ